MSKKNILITKCLKLEEITGNSQIREQRAEELVHWFARYATGSANSNWSGACSCYIYAPNINPTNTKANITISIGEEFLENLFISCGDPIDLTAL